MAKRVLKRRRVDKLASLRAYEVRMMSLSDNIFEQLEDQWLSSYDVFDTISHIDCQSEIDVRYKSDVDNSIFRLYRVCLERGVTPRGITSERIRAGERMAALPNEELDCIVYCGIHNSFALKKRTVFGLSPQDRRYIDMEEAKDQYGRTNKFANAS